MPQDETMKVPQAEAHFRRRPEQLEGLMRNKGLLAARLDGAGWLPLQRAACISTKAGTSMGTIEFAEEGL